MKKQESKLTGILTLAFPEKTDTAIRLMIAGIEAYKKELLKLIHDEKIKEIIQELK